MKGKSVTYPLAVALATTFSFQAYAADICKGSEIEYTKLKSEYEDCIRNTPGKFKEHNAACAQGKDCQMAQAVNKAIASSDVKDSVRAKYKWQTNK